MQEEVKEAALRARDEICWEALCFKQFKKFGFKAGLANSCCSFNAKLQVRCVVHGDDFTFSGTDVALNVKNQA